MKKQLHATITIIAIVVADGLSRPTDTSDG